MSKQIEPFIVAMKGLSNRLLEGSRGWEVRFETPPGAYLHLSKSNWGDDNMNGVRP